MTSKTPDPITTFIAQHRRESSSEETKRLKQVVRKRKRYAEKTLLPWREPEPIPDRGDGSYQHLDF